MLIPDGLTEESVLRILRKVANEKKKVWCFGYHSPEDIAQQCYMHCIRALNGGKFRPQPNGKPLETQLLNFLRVHTRNKLSNDIRNTMFRYAQPDSPNNMVKWNLMHTLKIYSQNLEHSDIFAADAAGQAELEYNEIIAKLRKQLTKSQFKDFLKWQNDEKLPPARSEALFNRVLEIVKGDYLDE